MRKNQKYTQEEMYLAVEIWQESGITLKQFCSKENLSSSTFSYWLRKYRKEKSTPSSIVNSFVPVELSSSPMICKPDADNTDGDILISYPNGIQVNCSGSTSTEKLIELIKL
jgi:hypothetical protein